MDDTILNFNYPTDTPKIIKVIGVGGGGGNAVTHMYKEGIHDVTFVLCNTDNQALNRSDVPIKLLLGREITQGLGAGNHPHARHRKNSAGQRHALERSKRRAVFHPFPRP